MTEGGRRVQRDRGVLRNGSKKKSVSTKRSGTEEGDTLVYRCRTRRCAAGNQEERKVTKSRYFLPAVESRTATNEELGIATNQKCSAREGLLRVGSRSDDQSEFRPLTHVQADKTRQILFLWGQFIASFFSLDQSNTSTN